MHSSHIQFCAFGDPHKPHGMVYRFETFRNDKGIVVLQFRKVLHLSGISNSFYESPKLKIGCVNYAQFSGHKFDSYGENVAHGSWSPPYECCGCIVLILHYYHSKWTTW